MQLSHPEIQKPRNWRTVMKWLLNVTFSPLKRSFFLKVLSNQPCYSWLVVKCTCTRMASYVNVTAWTSQKLVHAKISFLFQEYSIKLRWTICKMTVFKFCICWHFMKHLNLVWNLLVNQKVFGDILPWNIFLTVYVCLTKLSVFSLLNSALLTFNPLATA